MTTADDILERLGLDRAGFASGDLEVRSPITGELIARVARTDAAGVDAAIARARRLRARGATCRRPRRGELVRLFGEELRREKDALGALVTLEAGKIARRAAARCRR